jgi:excisionase family DNA binding protein
VSALQDEIKAAVAAALREELPRLLREVTPANDPTSPDSWLSVAQAAKLGAFEPGTIADHIERGNLPAAKPKGSREWRIRLADFRAFMGWQKQPDAVDIDRSVRHILGRAPGGGGR